MCNDVFKSAADPILNQKIGSESSTVSAQSETWHWARGRIMGHTQESQCLAHNFPILFTGKIKSYLRDKLYRLSSTCFPVKRSQISACPQQVYFFQKGEKVLTRVQSSSINSGVLFSHFVPCKSEKVNTSLLGTEMISLSLSLPRRKSRAVV